MTPARPRGGAEAITSARHGAAAPRGQDPLAGTAGGRFGRMFPSLPAADHDQRLLGELAEQLKTFQRLTANGNITSGYTYLAQFVDHDITFDPTSRIQRRNDPHALANFRTPRFDLDSVYGGGPAEQPFLYDWTRGSDPGVRLLLDMHPKTSRLAGHDLPRNKQGRALIGDARNDENVIVAQLHLLFIRMHNKVVRDVRAANRKMTRNDLFEEAQRIVRWHYQWIIVHDFLPKVLGYCMLPRVAALPGDAVIPVEFSGAAFRFGHSMVRREYLVRREGPAVHILRPDRDEKEHLGGFRRLKRDLEIEWKLFFGDADDVNLSMRIDPALAPPLFHLPPDGRSLASLNLQRGQALGLPSGSDVARLLGIEPLSDAELLPKDGRPVPRQITLKDPKPLLDAPPLWYYILCEAYSRGGSNASENGAWLGPVGGRIVGEVLIGLLERDPSSYLHRLPRWKPHVGEHETFTMLDLVNFVEDPAVP